MVTCLVNVLYQAVSIFIFRLPENFNSAEHRIYSAFNSSVRGRKNPHPIT